MRRHVRALRAAFVGSLSPAGRDAHQNALAAIVAARAAPLLAATRHPASYAAVGPEIDPAHIERLLKSVALPRISGKHLFFHIAARADLVPGYGNIPEPAATAPLITPDLLLVPLLAATPDGTRLGQGGGFYDRTLRSLRANAPTIAIGLAWDVQITDALPLEPWDERLDYIATPTRLVDCASNR
nr:5-formyltetrahydrofolate cyclo-ligase [Polymorphobacter sp.]